MKNLEILSVSAWDPDITHAPHSIGCADFLYGDNRGRVYFFEGGLPTQALTEDGPSLSARDVRILEKTFGKVWKFQTENNFPFLKMVMWNDSVISVDPAKIQEEIQAIETVLDDDTMYSDRRRLSAAAELIARRKALLERLEGSYAPF